MCMNIRKHIMQMLSKFECQKIHEKYKRVNQTMANREKLIIGKKKKHMVNKTYITPITSNNCLNSSTICLKVRSLWINTNVCCRRSVVGEEDWEMRLYFINDICFDIKIEVKSQQPAALNNAFNKAIKTKIFLLRPPLRTNTSTPIQSMQTLDN